MSEQKPDKRIVSKSEFTEYLATRAALRTIAGLFSNLGMPIAAAVLVLVLLLMFNVLAVIYQNSIIAFFVIGIFVLAIVLPGFFLASQIIKSMLAKSDQMDIDMADLIIIDSNLPAPDILLRASQEPLQAQKNALLRAAVEMPESHEKELLRASTGGQK